MPTPTRANYTVPHKHVGSAPTAETKIKYFFKGTIAMKELASPTAPGLLQFPLSLHLLRYMHCSGPGLSHTSTNAVLRPRDFASEQGLAAANVSLGAFDLDFFAEEALRAHSGAMTAVIATLKWNGGPFKDLHYCYVPSHAIYVSRMVLPVESVA